MRYKDRVRQKKYQTPKRVFKQVFFDQIKEQCFTQIEGHNQISNQVKAVINNTALAAMYKEFIFNVLLTRMQIDPNDVTQVNKVKKTSEFENGLLSIIADLERMNHSQADPIYNRAVAIYHDVVRQVLTNQAVAQQSHEERMTRRNEVITRRIANMRNNNQISQLQFGSRPEYNFSPGRRRQRLPELPPTPDDSFLHTPQRNPQQDDI